MSAKRIEHVWHIFRGEKKNFRFLFCDIGISKRMQGSSKDFFLATKWMKGKKTAISSNWKSIDKPPPKNWLRLKCFRSCTKTTTQPTYLISFSSNVPTHILHTLYHRSLPSNYQQWRARHSKFFVLMLSPIVSNELFIMQNSETKWIIYRFF